MQTTGRWKRAQGGSIVIDLGEPETMWGELLGEAESYITPATVRRGSRGDTVKDLQTRLAARGHSPGTIDGIFGSQTDSAVRAFQRAQQITADGIVGPTTWGRLLGSSPSPSPTPTPTPARPADTWVLPADVRAIGESFTIRYDSPPAWANGSNCASRFTDGARELSDHIKATFAGVTSIGGLSCRANSANSNETSVHGVGRALDIMIKQIGSKANAAAGDPIANWLVKNAQAIGIQYVIWNKVRWSGSKSGRKDAPYTGPSPHTDHIHTELNLAGSRRETAWFKSR
jgi:hypothetical protein